MRIKFLQDRINGDKRPLQGDAQSSSLFGNRFPNSMAAENNALALPSPMRDQTQMNPNPYSPHSHLLTLNLLNQGILTFNPPGVMDEKEQKLLDNVMAFWGWEFNYFYKKFMFKYLFSAYKQGEVQKEEIVNRNNMTDVSCFR